MLSIAAPAVDYILPVIVFSRVVIYYYSLACRVVFIRLKLTGIRFIASHCLCALRMLLARLSLLAAYASARRIAFLYLHRIVYAGCLIRPAVAARFYFLLLLFILVRLLLCILGRCPLVAFVGIIALTTVA